jgi:cell division septum initiation protein DivIVA
VDVHAKLDELTALVENARAMPMSASCVVNRGEVLDHIDDVRRLMPDELTAAERVLRDKRAVVAEGRAEAEELLEAARADAERMRREIDDYVDGKLANFEVVLHKTTAAVAKGRAKISGRSELATLASAPDEAPLPE